MTDDATPILRDLARILARALVEEFRAELAKQLPSPAPPDRMLRMRDVAARVNLHRTTVWRLVQRKGFPEPIKLTDTALGWRESDIEKWLAERRQT